VTKTGEGYLLTGNELKQCRATFLLVGADGSLNGRLDIARFLHPLTVAAHGASHIGIVAAKVTGAIQFM